MNASVPVLTAVGTEQVEPVARRRRPFRAIVLAMSLLVSLCAPAILAPAADARTATEASFAHTVLLMINAERAAHGLPALAGRLSLTASARAHNLKMAADNTMSHQLPGEPWLGTRVSREGYNWSYVGENIAWNSDMSLAGIKHLESVMYNETAPNNGHRLNILSRSYRDVGVDVYVDWKHHKLWLTTDFGHRM
jgi:uncharacterized protein YkwD